MDRPEDEFIMISSLAHYAYCPRRCALIHIEQIWAENYFTADGRVMHERVHSEDNESRGSVRISRGLPLRSSQLGLVGIADVIEFHEIGPGNWQPFPIEYKRSLQKNNRSDAIQLCAQAICLEEMLNTAVPQGALFYGKMRRRTIISFNDTLRQETEIAATMVRRMILGGVTPKPEYSKQCEKCSIFGKCLPKTIQRKSSVIPYIRKMIDTE